MRWISSALVLVGVLALLGSECTQELFAPIICEDDAECEAACEALCVASEDEVESAECDANGFCDCLCMPPLGMGGAGGSGGVGVSGSAP